MIVYKATNITNNKSYIGQTIFDLNVRIKSHLIEAKNDNLPFHNALLKYKDEFIWNVLVECESKDELDELEFHYIKQYDTLFPNGYNMTLGGEGTYGWIPSKETREKISTSLKGRIISKKTIEKRRQKMFGKKAWNRGLTKNDHPSLMRISNYSKKRGKVFNYLPNRKGVKLSEEHKEKIRQSKYGNKNGWHLDNISKEQLEQKSKYLYEIENEIGLIIKVKVLSIWCRENNIEYEKIRHNINKNKFKFGYKITRNKNV